MVSTSRKSLFWLVFTCLSGLSIIYAIKYFPRAFSIVNLNISMDRTQALKKAALIAETQHLGPSSYRSTASFEADSLVKTFVELEGGGAPAFNTMVTGNLYSPYTWQTRHFKEFETNELTMSFKPDGTAYEFIEKIAEETPGAHLDAKDAEDIARRIATADWQINFGDFVRVENSKITQPNGRIDHTFVYERPNERIGKEGRYRLRLVVTGDKLTQVNHFVKVPESFQHTYKEMRSANETLASAAMMALYLLYFFCIGIIGFLFLQRRHWIKWRMAIIIGSIMAILQAAASISEFPVSWISYNTTTPINGFIVQHILSIIIGSTRTFLLITGTVAIAEGLTRKAFGSHPQLWKIWTKEGSSSYQVIGRTIAGYLLAPLDVAYIIAFYLLTSKMFGWWQPSEQLFDPNVLACYVPWLNSVVPALHAGLWEECICRAFPLAAAALLAQHYGKKYWWIGGAFVLQALIFGAAHANYPAQPAYARLVELSIFSLWSGFIYLRYGLLPCIINHFIYDLIWFSLPLFISTAAYAWIGQSCIIFLGALPLIVLLVRRIQDGSFHELAQNLYNNAWQPKETPQEIEKQETASIAHSFKSHHTYAASMFLIIGILFLVSDLHRASDTIPLPVNRTQAIETAKKALTEIAPHTENTWHALTTIRALNTGNNTPIEDQHRFIWQKEGKSIYHQLLANYLTPAQWSVRFIRLNGSIEDRAEEYALRVAPNGAIPRVYHKLPQDRRGSMLSEEQARIIAIDALQKYFNLSADNVREISAISEKHPHRIDWLFTFADRRYQLKDDAQARTDIVIAGDQVSDYAQYIHVPETWTRAQSTQRTAFSLLNLASSFIFFLILVLAFFVFARTFKTLSVSKKWLYGIFICIFILQIGRLLLSWPTLTATFNAQEPYNQQLFRLFAFSLFGLMVLSAGLAYCITLCGTTVIRMSNTRNRLIPFMGTVLGIFSAGLLAYAKSGRIDIEPLWPDYMALNTYSPFLTTIIGSFLQFVLQTSFIGILVVALVTLFNKIRNKFLWCTILVALGFVIAGLYTPLSWHLFVIQGLALSISFNACFYLMGNTLAQGLPIILATIFTIDNIQKALLNPYPGAWTAQLCAAFVVIVAAAAWWHMIQNKKQ